MLFVFKLCIFAVVGLVVTAVALPNPEPLLANVTASFIGMRASFADIATLLTDKARLPSRTPQSTPTAQSPAADESFDRPENTTPTSTEIAGTEPVQLGPIERGESHSDALFRQFQAWAVAQSANVTAAQEGEATSKRVAQDAPKPIVKNPRKPLPLLPKRPGGGPVLHRQDARSPRKPPQLAQNTQAQVPPSLNAESQWTLRAE
jgi:hypothetical protein